VSLPLPRPGIDVAARLSALYRRGGKLCGSPARHADRLSQTPGPDRPAWGWPHVVLVVHHFFLPPRVAAELLQPGGEMRRDLEAPVSHACEHFHDAALGADRAVRGGAFRFTGRSVPVALCPASPTADPTTQRPSSRLPLAHRSLRAALRRSPPTG